MRTIVMGGGGFVGSHLMEALDPVRLVVEGRSKRVFELPVPLAEILVLFGRPLTEKGAR